MSNDYYAVLGVGPQATQEQIKAAYRRKVKEFHPDHYGQDSGPFRAIQEAYDVLSDPERRRDYDTTRAGRRQRPVRRSGPGSVEPLIPHREPAYFDEYFFNHPFPTVSSLSDAFFDPWWDLPTPPARFHVQPGEIYLELTLTPVEARAGGQVQIGLPVQGRCPTCDGSGEIFFWGCWDCGGRGVARAEYPLLLTLPTGIKAGEIFRVSLDHLGLQANLTVRFSVAEGHHGQS